VLPLVSGCVENALASSRTKSRRRRVESSEPVYTPTFLCPPSGDDTVAGANASVQASNPSSAQGNEWWHFTKSCHEFASVSLLDDVARVSRLNSMIDARPDEVT